MLQHKAYKFRLYPNQLQEIQIAKTIGCSRFVFNYFLNLSQEMYKETGKGLFYSDCSKLLPALKKNETTKWLADVDSIALQSSVRNMSDAFVNFFKKRSGFPKFKSKNNLVQSYTTKYVNNNICIENNYLKLPKLGLIKVKASRKLSGRIINATVSKTSTGKYFVSLLCEEDIVPLSKTGKMLGIDVGLLDFCVFSSGKKIPNPRFSKQLKNKLKREQRKLSKRASLAKKNGIKLADAKNYQKQKNKVAKLHEKIKNQRTDFLHKLSTNIIKNHDFICIEDLKVKDLLEKKQYSFSISDVSWSVFFDQLFYKATWYNKILIKVNHFFKSSQICSNCFAETGKKDLSIREWECPSCHTVLDRDINAAKNILIEGLKTVGTTEFA